MTLWQSLQWAGVDSNSFIQGITEGELFAGYADKSLEPFSESDKRILTIFRCASKVSTVLIILIGLVALTAVIIGAENYFTPSFHYQYTVKANGALCLILSGLSLLYMQRQTPNPLYQYIAVIAACGVLAIGAVTTGEHFFNWQPGIDQLFVREATPPLPGSIAGRMPPAVSLSFIILSLSLLTRNVKWNHVFRIGQIGTLLVTVSALGSIIGYSYGVPPLDNVMSFTRTPLIMAVCLGLLSLARLLAWPELWPVSIFISGNAGGVTIRRLFPAVVAAPIAIAGVRLAGEQAQFYGHEFGSTLVVVLMIVVLTALLYWNARSLDRHDTAYKLARILLKNEQRTHFILEKSPIGFIAANENGMITDWNQQATETFGWTRTEAVERKFTDVIEFRSENIHKTGAKGRLPDSKEGAEEFTEARELTGFHKSGHSFPVEAAIFPIHLDDRWSLYAFVEDISERKLKEHRVLKLAGELARSNAELQEFAKVASHDLQEPLRVIQGFADLLLRRYRGRLDSKSDEFLLQIVDGADRMSQLIEAVLAHSRVQNVNRPQGISDCNVVVVEAIRNLELTIVETGAQIACAPLPQVAANSSETLQLFQNLIGNAIKYRSCVPPKIDITVDGNEQHWLFAIKDNGIGIDAQYHSQIFDMFKRLHGRTEYAGTGIGLAICKKIVESYNGVIWVESEMGHGSTFFFTLPKFPPCDTYDRGAQESC